VCSGMYVIMLKLTWQCPETIIYDYFEYVIGDLFCVVFLFLIMLWLQMDVTHYALASDGCYLDISMIFNIQPILIICDLRN
jgi:hypothetical protein